MMEIQKKYKNYFIENKCVFMKSSENFSKNFKIKNFQLSIFLKSKSLLYILQVNFY